MRENTDEFSPEVQVSKDHYEVDYDDIRRWSSYWWQIQLSVPFAFSGPMLEIGIGNGVTTSYLRTVLNADVTTADIDPQLNPDVVADVASLPFEDGRFSCVIVCEVLEHTPYHHAVKALGEFRRISRSAVISVPNADRYVLQVSVQLGSRRKRLLALGLGKFLPKPPSLESGSEHHWEIGRDDITVQSFGASIAEAGWTITEEFRNPDFPYHHFFVLE